MTTPIALIEGPFKPSMEQFNELINDINANDAALLAEANAYADANDDTGGGGSAPAPAVRSDATALTAANITTNIAAGQMRYVLASATGVPITLPPATGSGVVLEFFSGLKPTSNGYVFNCDSTGTIDRFDSNLTRHAAADAATLHIDGTTAGNHNRMTLLNGSTGTGGERGDVVRLTDYLADHWLVEGSITAPAGAIAVFSAF